LFLEIKLLTVVRSNVEKHLVIQEKMFIGRIRRRGEFRVHLKMQPFLSILRIETEGLITKSQIALKAKTTTDLAWLGNM